MSKYSLDKYRNIGIMAHIDAGKTTTTERILFFESGEEDTLDEFNLPFPSSITASDWLFEYLSNNLEDSVVLKIGKFESGKYDHYENKEFNRTLYKVTKI